MKYIKRQSVLQSSLYTQKNMGKLIVNFAFHEFIYIICYLFQKVSIFVVIYYIVDPINPKLRSWQLKDLNKRLSLKLLRSI